MNRVLFLIIVGLGGAAILVALGVWQVQRLAWKEGVIADINARIDGTPGALPAQPDPARDAYLPVTVTGALNPEAIRVLVSQKDLGAGYRLVTSLAQPDGAVLVDLGFVGTDAYTPRDIVAREVTVTGNLQWPDETDSFTPAPDLDGNVWFARDVPAMAELLGTREVLVVAQSVEPAFPAVSPLPVDTSRIPNNHLSYAITWFSLAAIWLGMSLLFLRRRSGQPVEG